MITEAQILSALSTVDDPDLKKDLVSLGMIKDILIDGSKVSFKVVLTTPACPLKEKIRKDCMDAVLAAHPEAEISIEMTSNVTSQARSQQLPQVKNIIAVASGKGGVGKSTVATNLAVGLALSGAKTALVDADIYGPSMPIMFGMQGAQPYVQTRDGKDWLIPFEKHGIKLNSIGFLVPSDQAIVWRGPMASKAMAQILFDTDWGELDYMVIDLPPGTGDLHLTMVQRLSVSGVVMVTTPQDVALADAVKGAKMFTAPQVGVPVLGVVENMSWFTPPELPDKKYYLFGQGGGAKLAKELEVPVIAQIPIVEQIRAEADEGTPAVLNASTGQGQAFRQMAEEVARRVAIRNAELPPTQNVNIVHQ